jgi:hypothetical protein
MAKKETNRVGTQLVWARETGRVPWEWVVDETRAVEGVATWNDPVGFARAVTQSYRRNKWAAQPVRVEVWSEKGTVRGTLAPVLNEFEVPFRVMHGFTSATAVHEIASASLTTPQRLVALYVGDWDPSGLHMSEEDLPGRLHTYRAHLCQAAGIAWWDDPTFEQTAIRLTRIALTEEDVDDPELPSFPLDTKQRDPRHGWYLEAGYGAECWELDALSPVLLRQRVERAIRNELEPETWTRYVEAEQLERESIEQTVRTWRAISMPASKYGAP